jgi:hypothetical protein
MLIGRGLYSKAAGEALPDPSDYTLELMYNVDGSNGADGQLTNLAGYYTFARIDGLAWSDDGTLLTICNLSDDNVTTFLCSTAWDPSSIAASGAIQGRFSQTNPQHCGWSDDGLNFWVYRATDTVSIQACSTAFTVPNSASYSSSEAKSGAAFSFSGSNDGPVYITPDGVHMYWCAGDATPVSDNYIRHAEMSTPWDLDSLGAYDSQLSDSAFISQSWNMSAGLVCLRTGDGSEMMFLGGSGSNARTFTTDPIGDVANATLGTIDTTSFDNFSGLKDGSMGYIDSRGKMWRYASGNSNMDLGVWGT